MKNKLTLLLLALTLISCSTRKVSKSETKEKESVNIQSVDSSKTVTVTDTNTKIVDNTETNEIEVTPIDNTKPMVVNGKSYSNGILKIKATKVNKVVDLNEKVSQIEQKAVKNESKLIREKTVKDKDTKRTSTSLWWLLLLLLIPAYIFYKKYLSW